MMPTVTRSRRPALWHWTVTNRKTHHIIPRVQVQPIDDSSSLTAEPASGARMAVIARRVVAQVRLVYSARPCQLPESASMQIRGKARRLWCAILCAALCSAAMKETAQLDQFNTNSGGRRANKKPRLFMASTLDDNVYTRLLLIS